MPDDLQKVEQVLMERGILRVADLPKLGFPKTYLGELEHRGRAVREVRGIYRHPEADIPKHYSEALACSKVPEGVICLISALAHHEIGTQIPHDVWMAIGPKARIPKLEYPNLRIARFSGDNLTEGVIETGDPFGIRVFNPAKTVADCFKFRNKIGLDVAIEALREGWRDRRFTIEELVHYSKICRVDNLMRPYLEAIL
jgi:predicted transcriptional regulator of viral defense system